MYSARVSGPLDKVEPAIAAFEQVNCYLMKGREHEYHLETFRPDLWWRSLSLSSPHRQACRSYAWYYFAIFAGVIVGLMFEPLPGGAIGLIGVTLVARLSEYVFYSPGATGEARF